MAERILQIEEPCENVITEEHADATFECKVNGHPQPSCTWFKNGKPITTCQRIKITSDGRWYRLDIRNVNADDYGLYTITCKNSAKQLSSSANLFVAPRNLSAGVMYSHARIITNEIVTPLRNVKVKEGELIHLHARFKFEADCMWFRNNQLLKKTERIVICSVRKSISLSIVYTKMKDSGVYSVVAQSKHGIIASMAEVQVTQENESRCLNDDAQHPVIEELLPEEVETYAGEDLRLAFKAKFDDHTTIKWYRNGVLFENSNFMTHEYGDHFIGLRGCNVSRADAGEYTAVLRNKSTGKEESCNTYVHVYSSSAKSPPLEVELRRPIQSAVACCGAKITFDCSFSLSDPTYFYVIWYVGHYKVQLSNSRFGVICKGGEFILYIKKLEPGMAGEVVCELRRILPNRKSYLVNYTSSVLTIVPAIALQKLGESSKYQGKLYNSTAPYDERFEPHRTSRKETASEPSGSGHVAKGTLIMEINYCRLDDEGLFFMYTSRASSDLVNRVRVYNIQDTSPEGGKIVAIEWDDSIVPMTSWYEIQLAQPDGSFLVGGISSMPSFELKDPPLGRLLQFRVMTTQVLVDVSEARISIVPTPEIVLKPKKKLELKSVENFEINYTKTGDLIGCGAFGSVILVEDGKGKYYAAKMIKTKTQKKREIARREYETMKFLRHPKLIDLTDAYFSNDVFILIMDYLWGGELFCRIVDEDHIKEVDVIPYVKQICEGLEYLHSQRIAHLDLKPENIVCISPNSVQLKLIDFGIARDLTSHTTRAIYGTRDYIAPEVLNFENLTVACDMWSLGVVTYILLSGVLPFTAEPWPERSANITSARYNYEDPAFRDISDLARNFIDNLLLLNAGARMTATQALNHKWIREGPPNSSKSGHLNLAQENLKSYLANYKARWQRVGHVMIAAHRLRTHTGGQRAGADPAPSGN